jgi:hypothetical protein
METLLNPGPRRKHRRLGRPHGNIWFAGLWMAVLLQVHIFFVLQLHQHRVALESISQSNSAGAIPSLHAIGLLCPACQIARHGIVHPTGETLLSGRFLETERVPGLSPTRPFLVSFLKLSGRDPPHG